MKNNLNSKRFWEIDAIRGIAIVLMVIYHLFYDLSFFNILNINPKSGILYIIGRIAAVLFVFLIGISLTLSYSRNSNQSNQLLKFIKRGFGIFIWGLFITAVTWMIFPMYTVVFGILHFIGVAIIISYPLLRYQLPNLIGGIICFILTLFLKKFSVQNYYFIWLGLTPKGFQTFDYFPLLPWFGIVMFGLFTGNVLYKDYTRRFSFPNISKNKSVKILRYLGENSLVIYLIHQPIILAFFYIIGFINIVDFI